MSRMSGLRARVQNGRLVVDEPTALPEGTVLDLVVDDLDAGETAVLDLGARKAEHQPGQTFRVFLDPAGHPFCLCVS